MMRVEPDSVETDRESGNDPRYDPVSVLAVRLEQEITVVEVMVLADLRKERALIVY